MSDITLTLTKQQFDYICQVLAQRPYAEVAAILAELLHQSQQHAELQTGPQSRPVAAAAKG